MYWKVLKMLKMLKLLKMLKMLKTLNRELSETPKIIKIGLLDQENHNNELRELFSTFQNIFAGLVKKVHLLTNTFVVTFISPIVQIGPKPQVPTHDQKLLTPLIMPDRRFIMGGGS